MVCLYALWICLFKARLFSKNPLWQEIKGGPDVLQLMIKFHSEAFPASPRKDPELAIWLWRPQHMSLYRLCISSEQHPWPRPAGGWLGQVGADGARDRTPPGSSLVSLPSLSRTPEPRPCPLPQCQCCGLLILTYSSPTCQDERQEMGSCSSQSRSG